MSPTLAPRLLTAATIELLYSPGVVVHVATRDASLRPHLAYAYGCRVDSAGARITVGLMQRASLAVLTDIHVNPAVALVACNIRTFQTMQLKGGDGQLAPADDDLKRRAAEYQRSFVEVSAELAYTRPVMERHMAVDLDDLTALTFTVCAAFVQTPGPGAGAPLPAASGGAA